MSYRKEMQVLIEELRRWETKATNPKTKEKRRRQAEVLDFIINHPQDALANLKSQDD